MHCVFCEEKKKRRPAIFRVYALAHAHGKAFLMLLLALLVFLLLLLLLAYIGDDDADGEYAHRY